MAIGSLAIALGALVLAAAPALARTDLTGCTYYDSVISPSQQAAYPTRIWYVPDTGEVCDFLDCGGGRAPPKTTVPGCPLYAGTATYSPSFINLKTLGGAPATTATAAGRTAAPPTVTGTASGSDSAKSSVASTSPLAGGDKATTTTGTTAAPSVAGTASGSGSAKSLVPSRTAGDKATTTTGTTTTAAATKSAAAAAGPPAAAAVLGPCLLAGVAAGMGLL
ncbi:Siderophore biosynthesis enzyme [Tolypocladium capitatum]|uniref:Siderophore biosynthesis enzyme n=1 Tax=Tolypocladium capitatum TaxID=45235 RepID=A0A2K3Q9W7_9HYPO|nr:Siderophore biosynthesis enzyme [Tolypocladium capitatum]